MSAIRNLLNYLNAFFELFFPALCNACGNHLYEGESLICVECRMSLPYTNDWMEQGDNVCEKLFYGRAKISAASSFLTFRKKSGVQKILHELKYKHHEELGALMGRMHASVLKDTARFNEVDLVIPIPLHPKKFRERGYNQAELIAEGYATIFETKVDNYTLQRCINTSSQTRKSRYQRYENMKDVFVVNQVNNIQNKNIVLVDDVITTGATISSAAEKLLEAGAKRVMVVSVAVVP